ncbi:hypothetical protein [Chondrinema litorale]|uniref:hypothetical protein n=1 Tax=Chondrinema litorale TaxID=2994555 RepID=UPI002543B755|nr:hypothetical protein [Chondrinema litorale]UZR96174.1 hypothetical protein OQ292_10185 [Chondrinema litorale]
MNIYFSKEISEEESIAIEAKTGMIYASKDELLKICHFFDRVKSHLENYDNCHMHLQDNFEGWEENKNFDLEVNLIESE